MGVGGKFFSRYLGGGDTPVRDAYRVTQLVLEYRGIGAPYVRRRQVQSLGRSLVDQVVDRLGEIRRVLVCVALGVSQNFVSKDFLDCLDTFLRTGNGGPGTQVLWRGAR